MERAEVFEDMKQEINKVHLFEFQRQLLKKALSIQSDLRDWAKLTHNGRIYVGYKRINYQPFLNVYSRFKFKPTPTIEIVRRKIRRWLDKRK